MSKTKKQPEDKFFQLKIIKQLNSVITPSGPRCKFLCECDCGRILEILGQYLGHQKSCGCLRIEAARKMGQRFGKVNGVSNTGDSQIKHGHNRRRTGKVSWQYTTYCGIKTRCYNPAVYAYKNYGGRGISMFQDWIDDFSLFLSYIETNLGPKPSAQHTLDRKDNDGNYEPGNLRWATKKEQMANRRKTNKCGQANPIL